MSDCIVADKYIASTACMTAIYTVPKPHKMISLRLPSSYWYSPFPILVSFKPLGTFGIVKFNYIVQQSSINGAVPKSLSEIVPPPSLLDVDATR